MLAGCNGSTDDTQVDDEIEVDPDPDPEPDPPGDGDDEPTDDPGEPEDAEPPEEDVTDDPDDPEPDDGAEMLEGDPSTETSEEDGEPGQLAVTDVRIGTHDGFDRIVFGLEGDGTAGWFVRYDDEPTSQGSGDPIEFRGDAALAIAIHGVALPPELPEDVEVWGEGPLDGPDGGVVVEVVSDTIFEGIHTFVAGTVGEQPFLVERFEDPQRVVIDVAHGR